MTNMIEMHLEAAKEAFLKFIKQPISFLFVLLMLGIALSLPLSLYLGLQTFKQFMGNAAAEPQITIYMELSSNKKDIETINKSLLQNQGIKKIEFVEKKQAIEDLAKNVGMGKEQVINILEYNPLPDVFIVTPKKTAPEDIKYLKTVLEKLPMVESAEIDSQWIQTLYKINQFLWQSFLFLAITLSFAFILVSYNTIRLQTLSQKDEIEITKLLGASASFIRRPFLYQTFFQGLLTTIVGVVLSTFTILKAFEKIANILFTYNIKINFRWFSFTELFVLLILVLLFSLIGSSWAVRNHLQDFKDKYQ